MRPALDAEPEVALLSAQDAIASLAERMSQESSPATAIDPARPIALAFAAASEAPQPSEADRAILTAFAALQDTDAVRSADPELTAAVTRLAANENPQPQPLPKLVPKLAIAYAGSALLPAAQAEPAPTPTVAEPAAEIVLEPVELRRRRAAWSS